MQEQAVSIIRKELTKRDIEVIKIILFGSRARGDFKGDSDWDLLVIVNKGMSFQERRDILAEIYRKLAKLEDTYEIILKSEESFEKMKKYIGVISYDADKEGVVLWKS